jgi:amidase
MICFNIGDVKEIRRSPFSDRALTTPGQIRLSSAQFQTRFDRAIEAVAEVEPGAVLSFETDDLSYQRLAAGEPVSSIGMENLNRVVGPVSVRGAEAGDAIRVDVLDIEPCRAWTAWIPENGALGHWVDTPTVRNAVLEEGRVVIGKSISVPLRPCIGCIGVAPATGVGSTMGPTAPWGGNMDLRELEPGNAILLPVEVPGGLLSLGDLHAAMGHGEPTGVSVECAGVATVRLSIEKGAQLPFPRLITPGATICVGMDQSHPLARRRAVEQAHELLVRRGFDSYDAYAFISAEVELRLGGPASPIVLAVVPDA